MTDDKKPMQADGSGAPENDRLVEGQLESDPDVPAAEKDEAPRASDDDEDFKGGQSNQAYYGNGRLGERKVGKTHNAPSSGD